MIRLALYLVQESPSVNEVRFRADDAPNPTIDTRLYASADQIRAMYASSSRKAP